MGRTAVVWGSEKPKCRNPPTCPADRARALIQHRVISFVNPYSFFQFLGCRGRPPFEDLSVSKLSVPKKPAHKPSRPGQSIDSARCNLFREPVFIFRIFGLPWAVPPLKQITSVSKLSVPKKPTHKPSRPVQSVDSALCNPLRE